MLARSFEYILGRLPWSNTYIRKALQKAANRVQLAVCPPPIYLEKYLVKGGGQNANKLYKQPFGKPA